MSEQVDRVDQVMSQNPRSVIPTERLTARTKTLKDGTVRTYQVRQRIYKPIVYYLAPETIASARALLDAGQTVELVARLFGVSRRTVANIKSADYHQRRYKVAQDISTTQFPSYRLPEKVHEDMKRRMGEIMPLVQSGQRAAFEGAALESLGGNLRICAPIIPKKEGG